jgi:hypothetical protein
MEKRRSHPPEARLSGLFFAHLLQQRISMKKPALEIFDIPSGLTASVLAEQVLRQGYVVFDTTRPHARELCDEVQPILKREGVAVVLLAGGHPNFMHFLLDLDSGYDIEEFATWVTELGAQL